MSIPSYQAAYDLLRRASDLVEEGGDLLLVAIIGDALDMVAEKAGALATRH